MEREIEEGGGCGGRVEDLERRRRGGRWKRGEEHERGGRGEEEGWGSAVAAARPKICACMRVRYSLVQ